jgi:hypothetical protein
MHVFWRLLILGDRRLPPPPVSWRQRPGTVSPSVDVQHQLAKKLRAFQQAMGGHCLL